MSHPAAWLDPVAVPCIETAASSATLLRVKVMCCVMETPATLVLDVTVPVSPEAEMEIACPPYTPLTTFALPELLSRTGGCAGTPGQLPVLVVACVNLYVPSNDADFGSVLVLALVGFVVDVVLVPEVEFVLAVVVVPEVVLHFAPY
jgi:hypothetical protein